MKYGFALLLVILLAGCDAVICNTKVKNESEKYDIKFTFESREYSLLKGKEMTFENESGFSYNAQDFSKPSHSRVVWELERTSFTDAYTFRDKKEDGTDKDIADLYIKNNTGKAIALTSIGIFNYSDNVPESYRSKDPEKELYGYITVTPDKIDPFIIDGDPGDTIPYGTIYTLTPQFIAIDADQVKRIVEYTITEPETKQEKRKLLLIIR